MSYCTLTDLTNRTPMETLLQLADDLDHGAVDAEVIAAAIADADELIDSYLRGRYSLPPSQPVVILTSLAVDLCLYGLYGRRPEFATPERVIANQKNALALLAKINSGVILLGIAAPDVAVPGTSSATFVSKPRIFSRDGL